MIRQPYVIEPEFDMPKIVLSCQIILFAVMISPGYASDLGETGTETIRISADEANEDIQPGILHLKGHFLMQSNEWRLESALATVYGRPDKPDRVHLEGSPAHFRVIRDDEEGLHIVEAEAPVIEYRRSVNSLQLTGGAILKLDDEVIKSTVINYDIATRRYWAGGVDGVIIEVPPVD